MPPKLHWMDYEWGQSLTYTCGNFSTPIPKLIAEPKRESIKVVSILTGICGSGAKSCRRKIHIAIFNVSRVATVNDYKCSEDKQHFSTHVWL